MPNLTKQNIAIFFTLFVHLGIVIGLLLTPYKNWLIEHSYLLIILSTCLIIITQHFYNKYFFLFVAIASLVGYLSEWIVVHTNIFSSSLMFGDSLGLKINGVPLLMGLYWFVLIYCAGVVMQFVNNWAMQKMIEEGKEMATAQKVKSISLIIDSALLVTMFDYIIEPVAQKLGYWQWENNEVPFFNYTFLFFISMSLLILLNKLTFYKLNKFAIHLFIIQILFYLTLRIYF